MTGREGAIVRKGGAWAAAAALLVLLGACGSDNAGGSGGKTEKNAVILRDIAFKPERLTVKVGDTVTWRFEDQGISHDVVAGDGSFKSEVQDSGTFRHTFDAPGTYPYQCSLHPAQMKGTVVVR